MRMKKEREAALSTLAATAGTAFYPGRLKCVFFAQMGWASWIAITVSALMFMLLTAGACKIVRRADADSLRGAYLCDPGLRGGAWLGAVHAVYLILTAIWMLLLCGRSAERLISIHGAFPIGVAAAFLIALVLGMGKMRAYPIAAAIVLSALIVYALALAVDGRPVDFYREYRTESRLSGSVPAAILFACVHASVNALIGSTIAARFAREIRSPIKFAALAAAGMLAIECAENAALQRAGVRILSQMEPFACLAARLGKPGYAATNLMMTACACITLAAALSGLFGRGESC